MSKKQKILVCGDVNGNFKTLFTRVNSINEKSGPFDFLLCVGDFFSDSSKSLEPYKNGSLVVPVPTYILGPNKDSHVSYFEDMSGCEICPNVNYLGKHGILSSNGLKIAYLSGVERKSGGTAVGFSEKEASALRDAAFKKKDSCGPRSRFLGVDLLLSSEWPEGVARADKNIRPEDVAGSEILARLACQLKPRYHFGGLKNVFYERPPYKNCPSLEGDAHSTRFIGLANVGSAGKNKWLYAASLTPLSELKAVDLYRSTTNETECPYAGLTAKLVRGRQHPEQYFYDMNAAQSVTQAKRRKCTLSDEERQIRNFDDPETCWFCLASSAVEKHLVVAVGEEVYVALAKGGLVPGHVMIVPVRHHRAQTELSEKAAEEVGKYKSLLRKLFKTKDQVPVVFERNYKTSHLQLHVIPVPKRLAGSLKHLFVESSEERGLELSELPSRARLQDFVRPGAPYFYLELPSDENFLCPCHKNFPIQFGRDVLAGEAALDLPHRVDWRDCIQSKEEEEKAARHFRKEFEEFEEAL